MKKRQKMLLGKAIKFNPSESITKGKISKKIPMGFLTEFQRKIKGFELSEYSSGPKFRNGDTLVAKITPCLENGKTAYVDVLENEEVAFGSSEFIILRNTEFSDPEFIYYFARSPLFRERAISCMEGTSGRKRVNENILKNFEFNFPTLQDQQKIASVLSTLDSKIELNNRINAELEAMAKTIYDYWFVQFDFPSSLASINSASDRTLSKVEGYKTSGGEMVYNQELKREIPKGWEVKKLKDILKKNNKKFNLNDEKHNIDTIDLSVMPSSTMCLTEKNTSDEFGTNLFEMNKFDILFGAIRPYLLKAGFAPFDGLVTGTVHSFHTINEYDYNFALLTMTHESIFQFAISNSKGTKMPVIGADDLLEYKVPYNEKIVHKFNKILLFKEVISQNIQENQKLAELRDFLLPMLMNGQVVVE